MLSLIGILLGLFTLIFLAFKRVNIYIFAPVAAIVVLLFSGLNIWEVMSTTYIQGVGNYVSKNGILFLTSAIFAASMGASGAAHYIALKLAGLALRSKNSKFMAMFYIACILMVLTMGGISLFVVIFLIASIARDVYEKLDIPWAFMMANMWGSGTVTGWALPGAPSVTNLLPTNYLGTDAMAGPVLGVIMAIEIAVLCNLYIWYILKRAEKRGEHFLPTGALITQREKGKEIERELDPSMNLFKCLLPSIVVLVTLNVIKLPNGICLLLGTLCCFILFWKNFDHNIRKCLDSIVQGFNNGFSVLLPVGFMAGFGAVVALTPGFEYAVTLLDKIHAPEALQVLIIANLAAGLCGSASGGMGIMFGAFAERFAHMHLNPGAIHRLCTVGSCGLDSLPHNASIQSGLRVYGLELNWTCYQHAFFTQTVFPLIVGLTAVVLASMGVV